MGVATDDLATLPPKSPVDTGVSLTINDGPIEKVALVVPIVVTPEIHLGRSSWLELIVHFLYSGPAQRELGELSGGTRRVM